MTLKVLSVFGTRPEAIKMALVVRELERRQNCFLSRVCVTAQHRQLLDQVLELFEIKSDYDLDVMQEDQSPTLVATAVLAGLEPILKAERPDWVLVQGDTTTVAAAAMAAFYAGIRVGHVEAGLRSFDRHQPFPEEVNRRIATVIADLNFAPTRRSRENLIREGVPPESIHVTGNPVIDALHWIVRHPYDPIKGPLKDVPWERRLILVTAHRRENFGVPLENICLALREVAAAHPDDVHIVYPVHPNPNVRETTYRLLGDCLGVTLTDPLEYLPLSYLMQRSTLVLTDSGGLQEEAPGLGKPVLVMRNVTERPEAIDAGTARLVGTERPRITEWTNRLLDDEVEYRKMARAVNPFGDGHAAERIVAALTP